MNDENQPPGRDSNAPDQGRQISCISASRKERRKQTYHLHIELQREYEPLCKRNKSDTISLATKSMLRLQGKKNLDLWVDGNIYPKHPATKSSPPFCDITSFVNFLGDGYRGFYGYTRHLEAVSDTLQLERDLLAKENLHMRHTLEQCDQKLKSNAQIIEDLERDKEKLRQKQTLLGVRKRDRKLKDIDQLKIGCGGTKKRVHAIKALMHPQSEHMSSVTPPSKHLNLILNKQTLETILKDDICEKIVQKKFEDIIRQNQLKVEDVQALLDETGISNRGYAAIYRSLQQKLRQANIKGSLLPNPYSIKKVRHGFNETILQVLGQPFHIEDTYSSPTGQIMVYNKFNNTFYNIEMLQAYCVQFFEISTDECKGVLKFVIKLDECELVKESKMERVTITLMNRALDPTITTNDARWFSVQSESNILSLATFEVPSENFNILHWIFHKTNIPEIISEQRNGRLLTVPHWGSYKVEWHMAGDLKTLKCMYNISKGPTTKSPCLYCMGNVKELNTKYWNGAPDRHLHDLNFKQVLDIPLARVHICTMHGLCRIIEKLLFLYICFAWTLRPATLKAKAIKCLEKVLSDLGLHGGHVKIEQDVKRSTIGKDVPKKLSINGVKARRFLSMPTPLIRPVDQRAHRRRQLLFNKWRCVHNAVTDHSDSGAARTRKANVWKCIDTIFKYCDLKIWKDADYNMFKTALKNFHKWMIAAWTDQHITHYMHIICNHTPWFAKEYGSLSIWSTQGMEKTHYQARTAFFSHTRHGGGSERANSLEELHQWTYRKLIHRIQSRDALRDHCLSQTLQKENKEKEERKEKRKKTWHESTAAVKHAEWRTQCYRDGKVWKPTQNSTEHSNENLLHEENCTAS